MNQAEKDKYEGLLRAILRWSVAKSDDNVSVFSELFEWIKPELDKL